MARLHQDTKSIKRPKTLTSLSHNKQQYWQLCQKTMWKTIIGLVCMLLIIFHYIVKQFFCYVYASLVDNYLLNYFLRLSLWSYQTKHLLPCECCVILMDDFIIYSLNSDFFPVFYTHEINLRIICNLLIQSFM